MNDEIRKLLTKFLGECWHNTEVFDSDFDKCNKCEGFFSAHRESNGQRTFTTWQDLGALKDKLVEKGEEGDFIRWVARQSIFVTLENHTDIEYDLDIYPASVPEKIYQKVFDIFNAPRFCELVGEWWEEGSHE